jgi:hypothetical protein
MKELSLQEMEQQIKIGQTAFALPATLATTASTGYKPRATGTAGAGLASSSGRAPLGFWVIGAALRALWLKV